MNMSKQGDLRYQSFLLRCWSDGVEPAAWRFEVRDVSAEPQLQRFTELEQLIGYLSAELQRQRQPCADEITL